MLEGHVPGALGMIDDAGDAACALVVDSLRVRLWFFMMWRQLLPFIKVEEQSKIGAKATVDDWAA